MGDGNFLLSFYRSHTGFVRTFVDIVFFVVLFYTIFSSNSCILDNASEDPYYSRYFSSVSNSSFNVSLSSGYQVEVQGDSLLFSKRSLVSNIAFYAYKMILYVILPFYVVYYFLTFKRKV